MKDQCKVNKKVLMYGKHIAWIEQRMLNTFDSILKKKGLRRNDWIREQCIIDFSIDIYSAESINKLDEAVKNQLYNDKSDWLRTKIREEIKVHKGEHS